MNEEGLKIKSNVKDTVFRMVFKERKALLELYNAMNDSDYDNPEDLIITTLENSIFMGMKNDLSYILCDQLFLYEHQSTVNPNMPLRDLLYVSSIYSKQVKDVHIYSTRLIRIPEPKFVVFYNGTKEMPEYCKMKLSDAYEKPSENPDLELTVHHFNINIGFNKRLMERCKTLNEYMLFVNRMREYVSVFGKDEGVKRAVDDCIKDGILSTFLSENKAEVIMIGVFEYDEEKQKRILASDARAEGLEEGLKEGLTKGLKEGEIAGLVNAIVTLLSVKGTVSESIKNKLTNITDLEKLSELLLLASNVKTVAEFEQNL